MNEQIKQLYSQAGLTMNNPLAYEQWYLDALEKFAELIIKETLQVARAGVEFGDGMEDAVYKYFGVEE